MITKKTNQNIIATKKYIATALPFFLKNG